MANIVHDVWSVAPSSNPEDEEYFTTLDESVDAAYEWSIKSNGDAMIICKNGKRMLEIIA